MTKLLGMYKDPSRPNIKSDPQNVSQPSLNKHDLSNISDSKRQHFKDSSRLKSKNISKVVVTFSFGAGDRTPEESGRSQSPWNRSHESTCWVTFRAKTRRVPPNTTCLHKSLLLDRRKPQTQTTKKASSLGKLPWFLFLTF